MCDIVLDTDTVKRVSNLHFRIFVNHAGVCMLQDMSTNGTIVDEVVLRGKGVNLPQTRMLNAGSIIQILSPKNEEAVKFIVRIPSRDDHVAEYTDRFHSYMQGVALAEARAALARRETQQTQNTARAHPAVAHIPRPAVTAGASAVSQPFVNHSQWGMHWNGGDKYNVVGHLGKGAFASVFRVATKTDGQLYAAKELEKRRFMKNGGLDRKLDNEMQIMRATSHRNIVQYIEHIDHDKHLYIIMEYVPCGDLQQHLAAHGRLPEQLGEVMAKQVFEAMRYLHTKKITHRDIKPDNILIANNDPKNFWVKLSDFGLSKVVKDNETFLKTFCGTLLYCAPEVFPHYDAHIASKGRKRARRGVTPQQAMFHSYSQSVDIWSFGAVLWFSLCNKPPFEGVLDNTGRGMFEKIMMTPLDPSPLLSCGISQEAISLLLDMLNTDPAERPSPYECLQSKWFANSDITQGYDLEDVQQEGLNTIDEEAESGAEPDLSQLNIREDESRIYGQGEVSIDSADLDFLDPRESKRFKRESPKQTKGYRDPTSQASSSELSREQSKNGSNFEDSPTVPRTAQRRLFGEIGQSALDSSGILGGRARHSFPAERQCSEGDSLSRAADHELAPPFATAPTRFSSVNDSDNMDLHFDHGQSAEPLLYQQGSGRGSSSLMGAESLVRELNMESPQSVNSPSAEVNEPTTPRTPDPLPHSSASQTNGFAEETPTRRQGETPKQPVFSRQINLPISASCFFEPNDPSTHTLEYATLKSGHNFLADNALSSTTSVSLPPTAAGSRSSNVDEQANQTPIVPLLQPAPEFVRPAPRLGRLTSTADSFAPVTINVANRVTTWGRGLQNSSVYPDREDTRIPKRGIVLIFYAKGIDKAVDSSQHQDWTKLPDLYCVLNTQSSVGITVNGVKLAATDKEGKALFGRVHTGDVIDVWTGKSGRLSFVCEFFHGEAKEPRVEGEPRFLVQRDEKKG